MPRKPPTPPLTGADAATAFCELLEAAVEHPGHLPDLSRYTRCTLMVQYALGMLAHVSPAGAERLALASIAAHRAPEGTASRAEAMADLQAALTRIGHDVALVTQAPQGRA